MSAACLPTWSRLQVATKQSALMGSSGDFFEVLQHRDGRVSTVMADVCGNGPTAALVVALVRPVLQRSLAHGEAPAMVLQAMNDWFARQTMDDMFATAVAVRIDSASGRIEIASAGHLGPFIRRASGKVEVLAQSANVPLGILPGHVYGEMSMHLQPHDALVLVTDGITDPLSTTSDPLGEGELLRCLARAPHGTEDICHALLADGVSTRHDATVLVLQLPVRQGI